MMNGANPIDSFFSSGATNPTPSLFGSAVNFRSTFDQAMNQASTPADKAKVLFVQAKFAEQNAMANMFSDTPSSILGFGATDLFGVGGSMGLPSWAYDVQRLLGNNSDVAQLMSLSQQAQFLAQSGFNQDLGSLGTTGSAVNSLF
jgi:hypothetical protein